MQIPSGHGGLHGQGYFWGTAGGLNGYLGPCSTFGPLFGVLLVLYKGNTDLWGLQAYCWGTTSTRGLEGQGNTQYGGLSCGLLRLH